MDELLPATGRRLSVLPDTELAMVPERVYFSGTNRYRLFTREKFAVFYISGERQEAVAAARITFSGNSAKTQAVLNLGRQGVLIKDEIHRTANSKGKVTAFTFDNVVTFPQYIAYRDFQGNGVHRTGQSENGRGVVSRFIVPDRRKSLRGQTLMEQAILSLKPQYAELILSGEKTVELRNRVVRMEPGTVIWIYATMPVGGIVALAELDSVVHDTPAEIWLRYEKEMCIDRAHFDSYIDNRESVSALILSSVRRLKNSVTLDWIRRSIGNFQPPQFYSRLSLDGRLFSTLNSVVQTGDSSTLDLATISDL